MKGCYGNLLGFRSIMKFGLMTLNYNDKSENSLVIKNKMKIKKRTKFKIKQKKFRSSPRVQKAKSSRFSNK